MTQKTAVTILRANLEYMRQRYGVRKLALFGSFAAGTAKNGSDVDLVVEFNKPIGLGFIGLSEYLEKLLGRKVDILTPAGLKAIRVKSVSDNIRRSLICV